MWQTSPGGDFFSKFAFAGVLIDEVRTSKEVGRVQQAQPTVRVERSLVDESLSWQVFFNVLCVGE